jgi:hypothetical protein
MMYLGPPDGAAESQRGSGAVDAPCHGAIGWYHEMIYEPTRYTGSFCGSTSIEPCCLSMAMPGNDSCARSYSVVSMIINSRCDASRAWFNAR